VDDVSLGIVVVTHDSAKRLPACLSGIPPPLTRSTVVVDNASRDDSAAVARSFGVRVLEQPENLGFGRAATLGARVLLTRALCFLNPDCEPTSELFRLGLEALGDHPHRCAAPLLLEPRGPVDGRQPGYTRTKLLADMLESHYGRRVARWVRRLPGHHDTSWAWPHGACFFIQRGFFESLGGFDEAYFVYMEDVDLGRRIAACGGEVVSLDCRVVHHGAHGSAVTRRVRRALLDESRLTYARRVYGPVVAGLLRTSTLPAQWRRRLRGARS
jgi:GT2 family glycosyltransferase